MHKYFIVASVALVSVYFIGPAITNMMTNAITVQLEMQAQQLQSIKGN